MEFSQLEDDSFDSFGNSEDDDFELGAFDLSRVLSALQGMKEEIAGMSDEDERRKAAARVALGLVYGLRKEDERERDVDHAWAALGRRSAPGSSVRLEQVARQLGAGRLQLLGEHRPHAGRLELA